MRHSLTRRGLIASSLPALVRGQSVERIAVLTLDDSVKSHRTFVAPLLKRLGHGATFFITHRFMNDQANFMNWADIKELHDMGFEIGNHSWTHADFSQPRNAARLEGETALIDYELKRAGVPRPVSFAYSGNGFGPEAIERLRALGYRFARRGISPEAPYGKLEFGPAYDPRKHHRLLIPTTADAYPSWTLEHFEKALAVPGPGQILVLQFHGVPDVAHPWVHTPPEQFERYMRLLKERNFRVIALRDLERHVPAEDPQDPRAEQRFPVPKGPLQMPAEMEATRSSLSTWLPNMIYHHRYSIAEAAAAAGLPVDRMGQHVRELKPGPEPAPIQPYPGGRHTRIGFRDGAIDPLRGTKASLFLPWDRESYIVVDVPEAIFSNLGLLYLAHTHIPTIWNQQNMVIENRDWQPVAGGLRSEWALPNKVSFGASLTAARDGVDMDLWLKNGTSALLSGLRTQICVLLKEARGFNQTTVANKTFGQSVATVRDESSKRSISTEWEKCGRTWGNPQCPCMHSDPVLPDCPPGETVRVRGRIWFA